MVEEKKNHEFETEKLNEEIDEFIREKERVREIVGRIGGVPSFAKKLYNVLFMVFVVVCLLISLVSGGTMRLIMIELAIAAVSYKLIYLINCHSKMNHFNLWMLTSIEWRINEVINMVRKDNDGKENS